MKIDRQLYLIRFLMGCSEAADKNELHVDLGRLLINGDLMREAAEEFKKSVEFETKIRNNIKELDLT
jgi:uncharacterized protein HemY